MDKETFEAFTAKFEGEIARLDGRIERVKVVLSLMKEAIQGVHERIDRIGLDNGTVPQDKD